MPRLRAGLAALLTAAYAIAIVVPCETTAGAESTRGAVRSVAPIVADASGHAHGSDESDPHAGHGEPQGQHAGATHTAADSDADDTGHCHEPASFIPRCPCGCDEKSRARTPGGRLDPTVIAERVDLDAPDAPLTASGRLVVWSGADPAPPDKIPIHLA